MNIPKRSASVPRTVGDIRYAAVANGYGRTGVTPSSISSTYTCSCPGSERTCDSSQMCVCGPLGAECR
jgi:hypothetical protein